MKVFESAKWIWQNTSPKADEYVEFYGKFPYRKQCVFRVSVDGDYVLFVNGKYISSSQYGDFEHYKIYDEILLTDLKESNEFSLLVWHFGENSMRYRAATAGAIYEIADGEEVFSQSDERTLCRLSPFYKSHNKKKITNQLGFSFFYDATADETPFESAVVAEKNATFFPRPVKKSELLPARYAEAFQEEEHGQVFDLGEETVGFVTLSFDCEAEGKVTVCWGEDYPIRDKIGDRDFSFEYFAKKGQNEYTNYMLRVAARFLRVEGNAKNVHIGTIPQVYPAHAVETPWLDENDQRIYDICVNTLKLCMMEHYVDCPWREQCLYAFDSRNQMLCGYYAFEGGNFEYARANLLLMSKDKRSDKLLSICYPCGVDLTIPSFSLYYVLAVCEYTEYSGDLTLMRETEEKIREILNAVLANEENGLICKFEGESYWNFYDWSKYSDGGTGKSPDLVINALTIIALDSFEKICSKMQMEFPYVGKAEKLRALSSVKFSANGYGMVTMTEGKDEYTELAASLAILSGIVDGEKAMYLCKQMEKRLLASCSLSMKTFKYEAYLKTNEAYYKDIVLQEIREDYGKMLAAGSRTVWETIDGASAFENAGSLCHGWSAVPVYYFHKFK